MWAKNYLDFNSFLNDNCANIIKRRKNEKSINLPQSLQTIFVFYILFFAVPCISQIENMINFQDNICANIEPNSRMCYNLPFLPMQNDTLRALVVFVNFPSPSGNYVTPNGSVLQNYWPQIWHKQNLNGRTQLYVQQLQMYGIHL